MNGIPIEQNHNPDQTEDQRKRIYVNYCIIIAIPVMVGYSLIFWIDGYHLFDTILNLSVAASFCFIGIKLRTTKHTIGLYRLGIASITVLFIYNVGWGPFAEAETLWLLVYPLATFYLLGIREGFFWNSILLFPSVFFIFFPDAFNTIVYPIHFRIAWVIAVSLIIILSYVLESLRAHYIGQLERQNIELQEALADVKKLSGLLPICSSCKKIRDDKGYWKQIESYIHEHSEAQFSHGICPECAQEFYPDITLNDDSI